MRELAGFPILVGGLVTAVVLTLATPAAAQESAESQESHAPTMRKSGWVDIFATAYVGDGLRFNNPYRLSTVLGSSAESLSRTAAYTDLGLAMAFGDPTLVAHGLAVRTSIALAGVPQAVLTPSYLLLHRWGPWGAYGRVGPTIVLSPDTTWGMEGSAGAIWFARAGIGVCAELVGDIFYGAGTHEVAVATYPVLSGQAGLWLSFEAMP